MRVSRMPASSMRMLIAMRMSVRVAVRRLVPMIVVVPAAFATNMAVIVIVRMVTHLFHYTSPRVSRF